MCDGDPNSERRGFVGENSWAQSMKKIRNKSIKCGNWLFLDAEEPFSLVFRKFSLCGKDWISRAFFNWPVWFNIMIDFSTFVGFLRLLPLARKSTTVRVCKSKHKPIDSFAQVIYRLFTMQASLNMNKRRIDYLTIYHQCMNIDYRSLRVIETFLSHVSKNQIFKVDIFWNFYFSEFLWSIDILLD